MAQKDANLFCNDFLYNSEINIPKAIFGFPVDYSFKILFTDEKLNVCAETLFIIVGLMWASFDVVFYYKNPHF